MDFWKRLFDWATDQMPAVVFAVFQYMQQKVTRAENQKDLSDLELKKRKNHEKVDSDNAGVTDVDGVNKIAGPRD